MVNKKGIAGCTQIVPLKKGSELWLNDFALDMCVLARWVWVCGGVRIIGGIVFC